MTTKKLYIATSLRNIPRYNEVKTHFEQKGVIITYDWSVHGQVYTHDELRRYGIEEEKGVIEAHVFLIIFPGRNGAHYEMGMARILGTPIVILEEQEVEQKTFYHVPGLYKTRNLQDADLCVMTLLDYYDKVGRLLPHHDGQGPWNPTRRTTHNVQSISRFLNQ